MTDEDRTDDAPPLSALRPMGFGRAGGPFTDRGWTFEPKLRGHRVLAEYADGRCSLRSEHGIDITERFGEVAHSLAGIPGGRTVLDGQLCVLEGNARGDMERLHMRSVVPGATHVAPVVLCVLDILVLDDCNVMGRPWRERRELLASLPLVDIRHVRLSLVVRQHGQWLQQRSAELGISALLAKRLDSPYVCGAISPDWLELPCIANEAARPAQVGAHRESSPA